MVGNNIQLNDTNIIALIKQLYYTGKYRLSLHKRFDMSDFITTILNFYVAVLKQIQGQGKIPLPNKFIWLLIEYGFHENLFNLPSFVKRKKCQCIKVIFHL